MLFRQTNTDVISLNVIARIRFPGNSKLRNSICLNAATRITFLSNPKFQNRISLDESVWSRVNQTELQITKLSFFKRGYRKYISIKFQNSIRLRESARNEFPPNSKFLQFNFSLNGTTRIKFPSKIQLSKRNFSK